MKKVSLDSTELETAAADHFHQPSARHSLVHVDDPPSSALLVRFGPGGSTHWHRHPDGQYLYVLEGAGVVQARGEDPMPLAPGDCVYAAPGEEHWHGARDDSELAHLAFSFGVTEWLGPVDEEGKS